MQLQLLLQWNKFDSIHLRVQAFRVVDLVSIIKKDRVSYKQNCREMRHSQES